MKEIYEDYQPLNNLDEFDLRGTPNPYVDLLDEGDAEQSVDEIYEGATAEELKKLGIINFYDGFGEYMQKIVDLRRDMPFIGLALPEIYKNHRFYAEGTSMQDRMQLGFIGILQALQTARPNQEGFYSYVTLAVRRVVKGSENGFSPRYSSVDLIRIPAHQETYHKIRKLHAQLSTKFSRTLELEEIAYFDTNFTQADLAEFEGTKVCHLPLHEMHNEDETGNSSEVENIIDTDPVVNPEEIHFVGIHDGVNNILTEVGPWMADVLRRNLALDRYDPISFTELGAEFSVTYEGVARLQRKTLRTLGGITGIRDIVDGIIPCPPLPQERLGGKPSFVKPRALQEVFLGRPTCDEGLLEALSFYNVTPAHIEKVAGPRMKQDEVAHILRATNISKEKVERLVLSTGVIAQRVLQKSLYELAPGYAEELDEIFAAIDE